MLSNVPVGPSGGQVPCSGCGATIDPLRAGHVAIYNARFHYFCNYHSCRARYLGQPPTPATAQAPMAPDPAEAEGPDPELVHAVTSPVQGAEATPSADAVPERIRVHEGAELIEPLGVAEPGPSLPSEASPPRRDMSGLLVALTAVAGVLAMALDFAQPTGLVLAARAVLVAVGTCALCGRALTTRPDAAEVHRIVVVAPPLLATAIAAWALFSTAPTVAARASFFAGTIVTVTAAGIWLVGVAARPVLATRRWIAGQLDVVGQRVASDAAPGAREPAPDIRPGEQVAVKAGETVPVDLELSEGEVELIPWIGAAHRVRRRAGDYAVAGAKVTQGQLRGVCTWTDDERSMARPIVAPDRRCDVHAGIARSSRATAQRWAWVAAFVAGVVATALSWGETRGIDIAMVVVAVGAALGNLAVGSIASLSIARGVRTALSRGIIHNSAADWDRCARVSAAVFCARGTVLRGEPELAEVETFSERVDEDQVLALAAGAVGVEHSPWAVAVRRGARSRRLRAEPVRNPRSLPSLGTTAVGPSGEAICVGTRVLMVQRRVSVAIAEQRVAELESLGRTVMLVSRGGRLVGLLALQDGLRSGARAAVQHLLDEGIEPVLMSSDSRETCEALGRSLDIEHLRPEVAEAERADAVARIKDTGAVVAVLGHPPFDDAALSAADAAVALAAAGRAPDDNAASLVADDVRDAALALAIAHRTRRQAAQVLALVLVPAVFGALVVTAGLLSAEYAPLALLLGIAAAVAHLRGWDRAVESG